MYRKLRDCPQSQAQNRKCKPEAGQGYKLSNPMPVTCVLQGGHSTLEFHGFPKQRHQLGTKGSKMGAYKGYFSFKP